MRILVVGAGLGGLAAAIAARRAGHDVVVRERAAELRENGAGIGVMPNGVLALGALGLGDVVRSRAMPVADAGLRDRAGRLLLGTSQERLAAAVGAPAVVVPRRWLHRLLADGLPAGVVRTDEPVDPAIVETTEFDAVIAADGVGSAIRARLFPGHPGVVGTGEHAARGIAPAAVCREAVAAVGAPPAGELVDGRTGRRFGCMPMADGDTYWYATWRGDTTLDDLTWDGWHASVARLIGGTPPEQRHVSETIRLAATAPSYARGRVALLGDAAHAMTPDLGQGGCQAFEDAVTLGRVLAGATAATVETALLAYDAERRPRTTALHAQSTRMNRLLTLTGPAARLRDLALLAVPDRFATAATARQLRMSTATRAAS